MQAKKGFSLRWLFAHLLQMQSCLKILKKLCSHSMVLFNLSDGLSQCFVAWWLPTNFQYLRNYKSFLPSVSLSFIHCSHLSLWLYGKHSRMTHLWTGFREMCVHVTTLVTHKYMQSNMNRSGFWCTSFYSQWQQGHVLRICMADALWLGNRKQWIPWRLCPQPSNTGAALSPRE